MSSFNLQQQQQLQQHSQKPIKDMKGPMLVMAADYRADNENSLRSSGINIETSEIEVE